MKEFNISATLAYLGTIPFVAGAFLILRGYQHIPFIDDMAFLVKSYGLVIVVFMSGVHWGNYLSDKKCHSINLLLTSNLITLVSWFAFLLAPDAPVLLIYCLGFVILLAIDAKLLSLQVISKDYFRLRLLITCIVVVSLLLIIFKLLKQH